MKKIVHIIIGLGRGGAEMALYRYLCSKSKNDLKYEHEIISLTDYGCYGRDLESKGFNVYVLGLIGYKNICSVFCKLVSLLNKLKPDLVQTWMYHADLIGGVASKFAGSPPVLWGIHSYDIKRGANKSTRIIQKICAYLSSRVPTYILCVAFSSKKLHISAGYDESNFVVVNNGFIVPPLDFFDEDIISFRRGLGINSDDFVVGCIGRFHPAKDHRNFVSAASLLRSSFPKLKFLMIGAGIDYSNKLLLSWIDEFGMRQNFILLGERTDISLCLLAMDVFCSSSRTEAFPLVVGEAMALGRPVVATDVGDTAFLLGDTGFIVESENSQSLATGLERMLSVSAECRSVYGNLARQRICNEFSLDKMVKNTEAVYNMVFDLKNGE